MFCQCTHRLGSQDYLYQLGPPLGLAGERDVILLAQIQLQVESFPLSRKGMSKFQDLMSVRLAACLGRHAIPHEGHVLKRENPTLLKFRTAIRLVITEIRRKRVRASGDWFRESSKSRRASLRAIAEEAHKTQ